MAAVASALISESATNKVRATIAQRTPMSRTAAARRENSCASSRGRPNSLTSKAPDTLKRSVIVVFIDAVSSMRRRTMNCIRRPTRFDTTRNRGPTTSANAVTRQSRANMATSVNVSVNASDNTLLRVLTACWAPTTSLLSRLSSDPVCVRVKKAIGMRCTWS